MNLSGIVFQHPDSLYWLLAVPVLLVLFAGMVRVNSARLNLFGEHQLIARITPDNSISKQYLKFFFLLAAYILIIFNLAGPALSYRYKVSQPADLLVLIDVSESMLSTDALPNRLQAAKQLVRELAPGLENTRFGLLPFAGQAIVELPLSEDTRTLLDIMDQLQPETIPVQGTLIAPALQLAAASFNHTAGRARFILLLTDGEDHEHEALSEAAALKTAGIKLLVCGIGTAKGGYIPQYKGSRFLGYKHDRSGQVVLSRFNAPFLDSLTDAAGGSFFTLQSGATPHGTAAHVSGVIARFIKEKRIAGAERTRQLTFPVGITLAVILLLAEFILSERKSTLLSATWKRVKSRFGYILLGVIFVMPASAPAQVRAPAPVSYYNARKGNQAYQQRKYKLAETYFKANPGATEDSRIQFNLASALFQQGNYRDARLLFARLAGESNLPGTAVPALYDLGNCLVMEKEYAGSIPVYIRYLKLHPNDLQGRYNLAYARFMLRRQTPPPPPPASGSPPPVQQQQQQQQTGQNRVKMDQAALKTALEKSSADSKLKQQGLRQDW